MAELLWINRLGSMLQRFAWLALLGAVLLMGASDASAQREPLLSVGAGTAFPLSDIPDFYDPSAGMDLGLAVPLSRRMALTTGMTYDRFFFDGGAFVNRIDRVTGGQLGELDLEFDGGAYSVFSATAGLRVAVATPSRTTLYLTGAMGLFYETVHDLDAEARDAEGNPVEVRAEAEGNDTSYGFSLGAGVRALVAAGMSLFVEPRYVLVLEETQYLPLRVGVSFSNWLGSPRLQASQEDGESVDASSLDSYELSMAYQHTFFSNGDVNGQSIRISMSRRLFSDHTGLALGLTYRRAIDPEIQSGLGSWSDRQSTEADLLFFVDPLRFTTGAAQHRLRVGFGPALRHHWGEWPRSLIFAGAPGQVDVEAHLRSYDRVHGGRYGSQNRAYFLFTDTYEETDWGWSLELQYDLTFDHVVAGPAAGIWRYGEENVFSYGLRLGIHL